MCWPLAQIYTFSLCKSNHYYYTHTSDYVQLARPWYNYLQHHWFWQAHPQSSCDHPSIQTFIYSLKKQLLNDYHMPGIVRSTGHKEMTRLYLCLQGLHFFFHRTKAESEPLVSPSHVSPKFGGMWSALGIKERCISQPREFLEGCTEEGTFGPGVQKWAGIFQVDKCGKGITSRGSSMYTVYSCGWHTVNVAREEINLKR